MVAVGSGANPLLTQSTDGLALNQWGYIVLTDGHRAKHPKKASGPAATSSPGRPP
jgi:hypothetical protein